MKKSLGAKTIIYPTPVMVIGTYDVTGKANIMTAAWAGICCSMPPAVTISLRKATMTYENIMTGKAFTVNVPSEKYIRESDYIGMVSGRDTNKFKMTGLTPVKSERVNAPYIKEFPIILECQLLRTFEIGLHTQFIGEILDVKVEEDCLTEEQLDLDKIKPFFYAPELMAYYSTGRFLGKAFSLGKKVGNGRE